MIQSNTSESPEILGWLENILAERFDCAFLLQLNSHNTVRLSVRDSDVFVELASDFAAFRRADSDLPCTTWDAVREGWSAPVGKSIPAPGSASLVAPLIEQTDAGYRINYDIFGLTYWMLSRQEEVGRADLDGHGRFPATSSHAFKHGYLERPVVDEWLHILGQVIARAWPGLKLTTQQFSMKVSHDVDDPSWYGFRSPRQLLRLVAGDLIKRRQYKSALLGPWVYLTSGVTLHPADPANTFDWIMDVSDRHGLRSAFYFICGRTDASKDAGYEPEHPAIRDLMRHIHQRGHEIGLHPSYNSYQTPQVIAAEAARLRLVAKEEGVAQAEWGGRMHFLRWEHPTTMRAWDDAGMTYDSTLSYADRPGFRCGTCFEYPAFDPVAGKALRLRIRPLVAMECTVMAQRYMGLGMGEAALEKFRELKQSCRSVNGCFTLLWHNSQFGHPAERALYEAVLSS